MRSFALRAALNILSNSGIEGNPNVNPYCGADVSFNFGRNMAASDGQNG